jgi:hypothetical protein
MQHPIATTEQTIVEGEQLRLLSLFHYVTGGVTAFTSLIFLAYLVFGLVMTFTTTADARVGGYFLSALFGTFFVLSAAHAGLTVYSGRCIAQRKAKTFSLIMAGLNCLSFPYGTILGVCTFIVLTRNSVRQQYEQRGLLPAGRADDRAIAPPRGMLAPPPIPTHPFASHDLHHDSAEEQMWKEMEKRAESQSKPPGES